MNFFYVYIVITIYNRGKINELLEFMMKKKVFIGLLVILAVVYFVFFNKKSEYTYTTEELQVGGIIEKVTASGVIDPISTISVGTQVSGTIDEIYVDYNTKVKQGQLLAIIDSAMFDAKVRGQQASLNSAIAGLEVNKSQLEYNKKNFDRIKALNKTKFSSDKDLDIAQKEYDISKAQVELQKAQIEQIRASLSLAQTELGYTKIISPVDGIIVSKDVEVGQTVAASFQTPTLFKVAEDLSKMQISASVVETDVTKVFEGQRVEFNVDGYTDKNFEGIVIQTRNNPITVQNVVSYEVIIEIKNNENLFKPGMTANVSIITAEKSDILIAKNKALRFYIPDETNNQRYKDRGLWILDDKGEPSRVSIKIGIADDEKTQIISDDKRIIKGAKVITERQSLADKNSNKKGMNK